MNPNVNVTANGSANAADPDAPTIDPNAPSFRFDDNFLSPTTPQSDRASIKSIESINTQIETENMLLDEVMTVNFVSCYDVGL